MKDEDNRQPRPPTLPSRHDMLCVVTRETFPVKCQRHSPGLTYMQGRAYLSYMYNRSRHPRGKMVRYKGSMIIFSISLGTCAAQQRGAAQSRERKQPSSKWLCATSCSARGSLGCCSYRGAFLLQVYATLTLLVVEQFVAC